MPCSSTRYCWSTAGNACNQRCTNSIGYQQSRSIVGLDGWPSPTQKLRYAVMAVRTCTDASNPELVCWYHGSTLADWGPAGWFGRPEKGWLAVACCDAAGPAADRALRLMRTRNGTWSLRCSDRPERLAPLVPLLAWLAAHPRRQQTPFCLTTLLVAFALPSGDPVGFGLDQGYTS